MPKAVTTRSTRAHDARNEFLRVDKQLSKYTTSLNKYLGFAVQWGPQGEAHTKGLVLMGDGLPAAEIKVPNRVAQDHAARDPRIEPGTDEASLVTQWEAALRGGSRGLKQSADETLVDPPDAPSLSAAKRRLTQTKIQQLQSAADHYSYGILAKAFDALKQNAEGARLQRKKDLEVMNSLLGAELTKWETSARGKRMLIKARVYARANALPLIRAVLHAWLKISENLKNEGASDEEMPKDESSGDEDDKPRGLAAKLFVKSPPQHKVSAKGLPRLPHAVPAPSFLAPSRPLPSLTKQKGKAPPPPPSGAEAGPLERRLADYGLERFGLALASEGVSLELLRSYSVEDVEEVVGRPIRGTTRTDLEALLKGLNEHQTAGPSAAAKTPPRKSKAKAPAAYEIPFVEGFEDAIPCEHCGAPGRFEEKCRTCGKVVMGRAYRQGPRVDRDARLSAGQPPDDRPRGKQPEAPPPRVHEPQPIAELAGLPFLLRAFGTLIKSEVEDVAKDWTTKLGGAMAERTPKAAGFVGGSGSLESSLEELEMLLALGVQLAYFRVDEVCPRETTARALRMHARGLAIQIADEPKSAVREVSESVPGPAEDKQTLALFEYLHSNDKSSKKGELAYESSLSRVSALGANKAAVEALAELAEDAKLDKGVAVKLREISARYPEVAPALLGGGATLRLPSGTPNAAIASSLVSIRDRLIQEVGVGATSAMPGGLDATVIAKAAFEGKLGSVDFSAFFVASGDEPKDMTKETKAALALKGALPALEDLLHAVIVGDDTTGASMKTMRVRIQNAKTAGCSALEQVKSILLAFFEHHDKQWKAFLGGSAMPSFAKTWKTLSEDNANMKRFLARTEPGAADHGELKNVRDLQAKVGKVEEELKSQKAAVSECNKRIGRLEALCKVGFEAAQVDPEVLKKAAGGKGKGGGDHFGKGEKGGRGGARSRRPDTTEE